MNFETEICLFSAGTMLVFACSVVFAGACFMSWMDGKYFGKTDQEK